MEQLCDIIILGAGASGLMAAINAARNSKNVCILEHTSNVCQKLLVTGNGRCNLTNLTINNECYGDSCAEFATNIIKKFTPTDTIKFFNELGMLTTEKKGYVYPYTNQALTVKEVLLTEAKRLNINIIKDINVSEIQYLGNSEDKCGFKLLSKQGNFTCNKLIIATGSKAYEKTGSDGSGYKLVQKLGHTVVKPLPSLTALESKDSFFKQAQGVRCEGKITLLINDKVKISDTGELQLAAYGLSGIPTFQISRYAVKALDSKQKVSCVLDFLPEYSIDDLKQIVETKYNCYIKNNKDYNNIIVKDLLQGFINSKLLNAIALKNNIVLEKKINKLNIEDIYKLIDSIKNFKIDITDYKSFDFGQVCQGGVSLSEVNSDNLESKLFKRLYFAGEILDVDGKCGGYNLQWAFSSGFIAGGAASIND